MSTRAALVLLLVLASFYPSRSAKRFTPTQRRFTSLELSNFTCTSTMPSMWHEMSCILHRKRVHPSFSVRFKLTQDVRNFSIIFQLDVLKKDNTKMKLARNKLDGCKFLNSDYSHVIYSKFFKRIRAVSNIPTNCPLAANKLFEIRNYTELAEEYPIFMPALSHQFGMKLLVDDKVIVDIFLSGSVRI